MASFLSSNPDGKYFFFTSNKSGNRDIYWVDLNFLKQIHEQVKKEI